MKPRPTIATPPAISHLASTRSRIQPKIGVLSPSVACRAPVTEASRARLHPNSLICGMKKMPEVKKPAPKTSISSANRLATIVHPRRSREVIVARLAVSAVHGNRRYGCGGAESAMREVLKAARTREEEAMQQIKSFGVLQTAKVMGVVDRSEE